MKWTKDQQKVIDLRDRNILVSAAAGSGKTAVLVERIIKIITDKDKPIDVDRLLIVTFTKAAAAEMRERIANAVEKQLESNPYNIHLQKQLTLLHNAQITTIDSFCLNVIRNHFHKIDLNPNFRIADEGELKLLKSDVCDEVLEEYYMEGNEDFLNFVEAFLNGKTDSNIKELILKLFEYSMSYVKPKEWLEGAYRQYDIESVEAFNNSPGVKSIVEYVKKLLEDLKNGIENAYNICLLEDGPYMYIDAIGQDLDFINKALACTEYNELYKQFSQLKFAKLSTKRDEKVDQSLREIVKNIRDSVKKKLKDISEKVVTMDIETAYLTTVKSKPDARVLIDLTKSFMDKFAEEKQNKNIVDFTDLEHFTIDILIDEKGNRTEVAKEFAGKFNEILIDEYQDINQLQDVLLRAVSKEEDGINNLFMVGDVKQSIYKFRLARPELFIEKYNSYSTNDGPLQRIDLQKNFRSRKEVLDSINFIFYQIMGKDVGGIDYDDLAALNPGNEDYKELPDKTDNYSEFIYLDYNSHEMLTKKEMEAKAIGLRIKELTDENTGMLVTDSKTKELRRARYNDIVILLRSVKGTGEGLVETLNSMGIPTHMQASTGYFSTIEIKTILSFLAVIDNPLQDIPLAATLVSPFGNFNSNELATIKSKYQGNCLYNALKLAKVDAQEIIHSNIKMKINSFFELLQEMQKAAVYMPINELINYIFKKTGYLDYITSMPGGKVRRANARMLVERAAAFEQTSYKGLFNFNRYVEQLIDYEIDYGEASLENENDNTVKVMSIHKSKGLEFPIVILANMAKKFNQHDASNKVILHHELGIGMDYVDTTRRIKSPSLLKQAISNTIKQENLGEELRVLYVALTRAKEKLIMVGTVENFDKKISGYMDVQSLNSVGLSFEKISSASSYFDWVLMSLMRNRALKDICGFNELMSDISGNFIVRNIMADELFTENVLNTIESEIVKDKLKSGNYTYDKSVYDVIDKRFKYQYPYLEEVNLKTKFTVSELKKNRLMDDYDYGIFEEETVVPYVPDFVQEKESINGSYKGSVYHKVLELIDFEKVKSVKDLNDEIDRMEAEGHITALENSIIYRKDIMDFIDSPLTKRMIEAKNKGLIFKEQPFVIGKKASDLIEGCRSSETLLVQGIIDLFFEEKGDIILVDYKTDRVSSEAELVDKYKVQLDLYAKALEMMKGKKVKEKLIYSFCLKRIISC